MRPLTGIGLLLLLVLLSGCGQKGPLYLPGNEEAAAEYDPGDEYAEPDPEEGTHDDATSSDDRQEP
ncbi:lipoprotein-attachment site-containing protein [Modicisalibacter ilicicola DSM 19980]|uniref:Lipoprotein-attachment site-containing protein n=1 Tax=Modicisalibacter ilicicola DSM 19980 TaxID=1121942 RepID=A0A1M5AIM0_9GAMM|nr:lipoprotein [Halomonas ilicicola]SHF30053.1 lipoprotein-attachment site-containing protein [Halomonas ilicicola DSM 19980]